jgi:hypothetical protein
MRALSAFCRAEDVAHVRDGVREGMMEALRCRGNVERARLVRRLQHERREPKNQRKELRSQPSQCSQPLNRSRRFLSSDLTIPQRSLQGFLTTR